MASETIVVFAVLVVMIALFMIDRMRLDLVALMALLALSVTGILTPAESFAGFSDPVVLMITGLFVVAGAIFRTGLADRFGRLLGRFAGTSRARATAVVMVGTGLLSAFMSTTGTVALMLPVTTSLARNARLSPSLLLIPLAVGALMGGLLTLIATPPNIIVANQLASSGYEPFGFFDFTPVGLVLLAVGTALLVVFGDRLLPARAPIDKPVGTHGVASMSGRELAHGYALGPSTRVRVSELSPLVGESSAGAALRRRFDVNIVAIMRQQIWPGGKLERVARTAEEPIRAGDLLDVHGTTEDIERFCRELQAEHIGTGTDSEAVLAEVLLTPRSRLIGQSLVQVRFRSRYGANVLSLRRHNDTVDGDLAHNRQHAGPRSGGLPLRRLRPRRSPSADRSRHCHTPARTAALALLTRRMHGSGSDGRQWYELRPRFGGTQMTHRRRRSVMDRVHVPDSGGPMKQLAAILLLAFAGAACSEYTGPGDHVRGAYTLLSQHGQQLPAALHAGDDRVVIHAASLVFGNDGTVDLFNMSRTLMENGVIRDEQFTGTYRITDDGVLLDFEGSGFSVPGEKTGERLRLLGGVWGEMYGPPAFLPE